jgi:integrase
MATEKIGIYRRWLEPAPVINGVPVSKADWSKQRRHSWEVRWFSTKGQRYSKSFETKKLAEQFARQLQEDVNRGKADRPEKVSLSSFMKEHKKVMIGQVAHATLCDQIRALKLFENFIGGSTFLTSIKPRNAEAFIANRLASGLAVASVNKDIRTLKRIFNLAIEPRGYLAEGQNPFAKIKQRKKTFNPIRYVSISEYHALLDAADNIGWKAVLSIAYGSGLRRDEISNLTWSDIDFESKLISINAKHSTELTVEWEPKDHENRKVPLAEQSLELLAKIQLTAPEGHPYIFVTPERLILIKGREKAGTWNTVCEVVNNIGRTFESIRKRSGIAKCTLHDLRRSAITNWAKHLPIQVVQQFAGHSDISTTRKYYLAVRPEDIASANQIINKMMECVKSD